MVAVVASDAPAAALEDVEDEEKEEAEAAARRKLLPLLLLVPRKAGRIRTSTANMVLSSSFLAIRALIVCACGFECE